jgi:hypothetical protein
MNWHTFKEYCPDNKFCDGWFNQSTGEGYAISSTVLWETTDGGYTWDTLSLTGSPRHQEEYHRKGNTLILPHAGNSCGGSLTNQGGVIVSHDGGLSWSIKRFGNNVYGTTMLNEFEAWAAGDNGILKYTADGGNTWEDKDCGTTGNDLDDVFFLNANVGWAVGRDAVYRLVPPEKLVEPLNKTFPTTCLGETARDTVWVKNRSFYQYTAELTLTTGDVKDIEIISPDMKAFPIPPCDSVPVVFEYSPTTKNITEEYWEFVLDNDPNLTFTVGIQGVPMFATAEPAANIIKDSAYCNTKKIVGLDWTTDTDLELIYDFYKDEGPGFINFEADLPFYLDKGEANTTHFSMTPPDTGWYDAEFEISTNPCDNPNTVEVFCYGISSIITAPDTLEYVAECFDTFYDTVKVENTGNYDLIIDGVTAISNQGLIEAVNFEGEAGLTTTIPPGTSKNLIYRFLNGNDGLYTGQLVIVNNDSTKARGNKNPFIIDVRAFREKTNLTSNLDTLDFGNICKGIRFSEEFLLGNIGHKTAIINEPTSYSGNLEFKAGDYGFPFSLEKDLSKKITVNYTGFEHGPFSDTITVTTDPCGETKKIVVKGNVVEPKLAYSPSSITDLVRAGEAKTYIFKIENIGDVDLTILSASLQPTPPNVDVTFNPSPPFDLGREVANDVDLRVTVFSSESVDFDGCLAIEATGDCPLDTCIPMNITISDRQLVALPDTLDFGYIECTKDIYKETVSIYNGAVEEDTIVSVAIVPGNTPFSVKPRPNPEIYIGGDSQFDFEIGFNADKEGYYEADLVIQSIEPDGQTLTIPLRAEFRQTATTHGENEFYVGVTDTCYGVRKFRTEFFNSGTIDDSLTVSYANPNMNVFADNYIIVPAEGSAFFDVDIDYGLYEEFKTHKEIINLESQTCGDSYTVTIESDIVKPKVETDKDKLSFEAWMGYSETKNITVANKSGAEIEMFEISTVGDGGNYTFDPTDLRIMPDGDDFNLEIKYDATAEGTFYDTLLIKSRLNCTEIDSVFLEAYTPVEEYFLKLDLDKKNIKIDTTDYLTLSLIEKVPFLRTDSLEYAFRLDPNVAKPEKVYFNKGNEPFEEVPFSYSNGVISGRVEGDYLTPLFEEPNALMKIEFLGLSANPDSTTVLIEKFDPVPTKPVFPTYDHGFIQIVEYCRAEVVLGQIVMTAVYEVVSVTSGDNELALKLHVKDGEIEFESTLIDINGNVVLNSRDKVGEGEGVLTLDVSSVPSGAYFLKLDSHLNQVNVIKVIIVQ